MFLSKECFLWPMIIKKLNQSGKNIGLIIKPKNPSMIRLFLNIMC